MAEIDRERLIDKYPAINYPPMDHALNTTVQAVVRGDQIAAKTWGIWGNNSALWDPVLSPEMHARADAVLGDLRAAIAAGELNPDTHDED